VTSIISWEISLCETSTRCTCFWLMLILLSTLMHILRVSFNFGDISLYNNTTESASIQLISRTNQSQSYRDFVAKRNTTLRSRPPLYDIKRLNQSSDGGQWIVGLSSHNADTGTQSSATTQMQMLDAHNQLIRIGVD
jgi:hypothetical protein